MFVGERATDYSKTKQTNKKTPEPPPSSSPFHPPPPPPPPPTDTMGEQAKRRKVEVNDTIIAKEVCPDEVREGSPDARCEGEASSAGGCTFPASSGAASPSPTRASPSPNLTPRPPQNGTGIVLGSNGEPLTRSRPPSLPRESISPVRVPFSVTGDSRSNAPSRDVCSLELPPQSAEEPETPLETPQP
eukprot:Rhum_TRINITY_DN25200_c0_g2::Rhum_TRINITY_DN25200_c0_g2_i1::g.181497::m.181497